MEAFYTIILDREDQPTGLRQNTQAITQAAADATTESLCAAMAHDAPLLTLLGALHLVPHTSLPHPPQPRGLLDETLLRLIADPRKHIWRWGSRSYQHRTFEVGTLAAEARMKLLETDVRRWHNAAGRHKWSRTDTPAPTAPDAEATLCDALRAALDNMGGPGAVRAVMRGARNMAWRLPDKALVAAAMADCFLDIATDPAQIASARLMATRELHRAAQTRPEKDHQPYQRALQTTLQCLIPALDDPGTDFRLRRELQALLMDVAPETIEPLQHQGVLTTAALPPAHTLLSSWGHPDAERTTRAARTVCLKEAVQALQSDDERDVFAAACLCPQLVGRIPWETLAQHLLKLIPQPQLYPLESRRWLDLGEFATERLLKVLGQGLRGANPRAFDLLHQALTAILGRNTPFQNDNRDPTRRTLDAVRWLPTSAREALHAHIAPRITQTERPALERFAACLLTQSDDTARLAASMLVDEDTPAVLRAWIGAWIHKWQPRLLESFVDVHEDQWRPLEGLPRPLPVCEPGADVPTSWLLQTLRDTTEPLLAMRAVRHLGNRLADTSKPLGDHAQLLLGEADDTIIAWLRLPLDIDREHNTPRWQAACALALMGLPDDQQRLIEFMVHNGPWTRLDPGGTEIQDTKPLEHLLVHPLTFAGSRHMLEPHLEQGYGSGAVARMMASTFTTMAQRSLQHGRIQSAITAIRRACRLDPLNLSARRTARSLGVAPIS